jgi:hypothetical protein
VISRLSESILATEGLPPGVDLFGLDLAEDGRGLADLMAGRDQLRDPLGVSVDEGEELFVALTALTLLVEQTHLLVDLRREARNERLQHRAQQAQCTQACRDYLPTSTCVTLCQIPRLVVLDVEVAEGGIGHADAKTVLDLDLLEQVSVLFELGVEGGDEFAVVRVLVCLGVHWDFAAEGWRG